MRDHDGTKTLLQPIGGVAEGMVLHGRFSLKEGVWWCDYLLWRSMKVLLASGAIGAVVSNMAIGFVPKALYGLSTLHNVMVFC